MVLKNNKLSRHDLLIKVAKMYYMENASQEEIAKEIGFSRSNISRLLSACREEKIVEFKINDTSSKGLELQDQIKEFYGLQKVIVVPTENDNEKTKLQVAKAAAAYLESVLRNGMLVGIAWGTTLYQIVQNFKPEKEFTANVIQLLGGMGSKSLDTDGQALARDLASKLHGDCYLLQTPLFVQSKLLKDMLLDEPHIKQHFDLFKKIDIALIGIGSNIPEHSAVYRSGYITKKESQQLIKSGAAADICGYKIDINGYLCPLSLSERIIGIDLNQLIKVPIVLGAASGIEKAEAIIAGLRGKYIKVLVVDEKTALKVLDMEGSPLMRHS
ncbi:MAG: sugar-binding transcriptional regulator [Bacteroidota bacterium]